MHNAFPSLDIRTLTFTVVDQKILARPDLAVYPREIHRIEPVSVLSMKPMLSILDEPAAGIDMLPINHTINVIPALAHPTDSQRIHIEPRWKRE